MAVFKCFFNVTRLYNYYIIELTLKSHLSPNEKGQSKEDHRGGMDIKSLSYHMHITGNPSLSHPKTSRNHE
jgi:hypothetical protein